MGLLVAELGTEFLLGFQPILQVAALRLAALDPLLVGPHRDFVVRNVYGIVLL